MRWTVSSAGGGAVVSVREATVIRSPGVLFARAAARALLSPPAGRGRLGEAERVRGRLAAERRPAPHPRPSGLPRALGTRPSPRKAGRGEGSQLLQGVVLGLAPAAAGRRVVVERHRRLAEG